MNKDSSVYKMTLLGVICAICGVLLAGVNALTAPIIEANSMSTVKSTLESIFPGAEFTDVSDEYLSLDTSGQIDAIYKAEGEGYIFSLNGMGYSTSGFTFMLGIDNDGKIAGYQVLEQSETSGVGSKAWEDDYTNQILSLSVGDDVPVISGASKTTGAVKTAIEAAEAVFEQIAG